MPAHGALAVVRPFAVSRLSLVFVKLMKLSFSLGDSRPWNRTPRSDLTLFNGLPGILLPGVGARISRNYLYLTYVFWFVAEGSGYGLLQESMSEKPIAG